MSSAKTSRLQQVFQALEVGIRLAPFSRVVWLFLMSLVSGPALFVGGVAQTGAEPQEGLWWALCPSDPDGGPALLEPAALTLGPTGEGGRLVVSSPCRAPIVMLRGLSVLGVQATPRAVPSVPIVRGRDASYFADYGDRRVSLRRDARNGRCRVLITYAGVVQPLMDRDSAVPCQPHYALRWTGDLDSDGLPDLLVTWSDDGRCWIHAMMLSKRAGRGQVVGKALWRRGCMRQGARGH